METRNTKQKELILNIMSKKDNMIHPTIQELTDLVTQADDSIGQATIYRNINKLVKEGKIKRIPTNEGFRYDINTNVHGHLTCRNCGEIIDLYDENYQRIISELEQRYNISIESSSIIYDGLCEECKKTNL